MKLAYQGSLQDITSVQQSPQIPSYKDQPIPNGRSLFGFFTWCREFQNHTYQLPHKNELKMKKKNHIVGIIVPTSSVVQAIASNLGSNAGNSKQNNTDMAKSTQPYLVVLAVKYL
jgi:hypothetical protein